MSMDLVFSWLLTYWVHSTIALAGTWLASAFLRRRNLALEESAWKAAMLLTLLTATVQVGLASATPFRPLAGAVEWTTADGIGENYERRARATGGQEAARADFAVSKERLGRAGAGGVDPEQPVRRHGSVGLLSIESLWNRLNRFLLAFWLAVVSLLALKLVVSYSVFASRLRSRRMVTGGPFVALLVRLKERAGVVREVGLSVCRRLSVPLALGYRRWEVCLPTRLTVEFDADEQETVLAHELAHLVRRDALWSLATRLLAGVLFFQPLNLIARARLAALAEIRCDDWAVAQTGRPVTLARCLTRVAAWRSDAWAESPAPAMAGASRSHFGSRVRRLLAREYPLPPARVPRWVGFAVVPMVVLFAAAAPGIVHRSPADPPAPPAPPAVPAPEAAQEPMFTPRPVTSPLPAPVVSVGLQSNPALPAAAPSPASLPAAAPIPAAEVVASAVPRPAPKAAIPPEVGTVEPAPLASARYAYLTPSGDFQGAGEASPAPRNPGSVRRAPGGEAPLDEADSDWDSDDSDDSDDSADSDDSDDSHDCDSNERELEKLEDALEAEIEAWEDAFESEFEAIEDELEGQMERFEDQIEEASELAFETYQDALELDVARAFGEIESMARNMALRPGASNDRHRRRDLEREIERSEADVERLRRQEERRLEGLARDLERSVEDIWSRDFEHRIERAMELQENAIERRIEVAERELAAAARALETSSSEADRARLRAHAVEQARRLAPGEDELAQLRAGFEGLREQITPRIEEMELARAEFERALAAWRTSYQMDLERLLAERRKKIEANP